MTDHPEEPSDVSTSRCARRCRGEDGAFTTWFVVLVVPMMMMAGLVFDGGHVLAGRREALDVAHNAALAGVQAVDETQARTTGVVSFDPAAAQAAANNYLAINGFTGSVAVDGTSVTVTVTNQIEMQLLSVVGVGDKTVTGTATARIVRGVEGADT